jgi:hypothetical protein
MSDWKLSPALARLLKQVNERWPNRSKESDGTIGNAEHASRGSDHNRDERGYVCALDITHDPRHGFNSYAFAELLLAARDPRIEYVISNHKIASSHVLPWTWRKYRGANPHDHHVHISVKHDPKRCDDPSSWNLDGQSMPPPDVGHEPAVVTLRRGSSGSAVRELQSHLKLMGLSTLRIDGAYGPATVAAVRWFQKSTGLPIDGIAGPMTQAALKEGLTPKAGSHG